MNFRLTLLVLLFCALSVLHESEAGKQKASSSSNFGKATKGNKGKENFPTRQPSIQKFSIKGSRNQYKVRPQAGKIVPADSNRRQGEFLTNINEIKNFNQPPGKRIHDGSHTSKGVRIDSQSNVRKPGDLNIQAQMNGKHKSGQSTIAQAYGPNEFFNSRRRSQWALRTSNAQQKNMIVSESVPSSPGVYSDFSDG